jgi:DNA-binding LacI/PurR family transcriptional regulator
MYDSSWKRSHEVKIMTVQQLRRRDHAPTLGEVADLAGVSIATASRVLNNSAPVSLQARQQVREAVVRLGYVRHRAAPSTPRGRIRTAAAVVCTNHSRFFADAFFGQVIAAATEVLAAADIPLTLMVAPDERVAPVERYLHSGHVDGVLLLAAHGQHPLAVSLPAMGLPVTLVGRPMCATRASYVDVDNRGGGRQAVEHLLSKGRTSIATIAGRQDMAAGADRLAGYRETLEAAGLPPAVAYGDFTHASGVHAMWRLLDQRPNLDAVFVASDIMAAGALHALRKAGRRVPDDVAVVGFDDLPLAQHTQPPLTTIRQPLERVGAAAAQRLLSELDGTADPIDPVLPTTLVTRASA